MISRNDLYLHEEILLLTLRDAEGTAAMGTMYQFAIGGALLSELLLNNRIKVQETRWSKIVEVVDPRPVGDSLLDECLDRIRDARRRASLQTWVTRFANLRNIKHRVAGALCKKGILRADEDKVLMIFTRKIYPEVNPEPERKLLHRMREAISSYSQDIDPRTLVLISLAESSGLLKVNFDRSFLKQNKSHIKMITSGQLIGKAAGEAIQAAQAAIAIAAIMPALVASATANT